MTKQNYELEYDRLHDSGEYKYTLTGAPTHLRWTSTVQGDTYKEIWDKLMQLNEIDLETYERDFEIYNVSKEEYTFIEPANDREYKTMIETYLKTSNNYYYSKSNL